MRQTHIPCDECGSSDALTIYENGSIHCHSCDYHSHIEADDRSSDTERAMTAAETRKAITPLATSFVGIPRRGLTEDSIAKYQIDVNLDKNVDVAHRYPYFKEGKHVANKVRMRSKKEFYIENTVPKAINEAELFGQSLFPAGGAKSVTIVEGELDAASAYQLMGSKYPVVSVTGAGAAVRDVKRNFMWLNSFNEIVICFDKDEAKHRPDGSEYFPGQEAAQKVAELFPPGKVRILTLQHGKDPNDYLQNGVDYRTFVHEWWQAPVYRPEGLRSGFDMRDEILSAKVREGQPYPWPPLNEKTYGMRKGDVILLMGDTGDGKTSFMKEIEFGLLSAENLKKDNVGIGYLHLEETNADTAIGMLSIAADKPFHLPDTPREKDELGELYDKFLATDRVQFYDHFGSNDIDIVLTKIRHMAVLGCRYVFLDHLSIIVSDTVDDERRLLDSLSTRLKMLAMELGITIVCVIHTNRMGQARSSAGPEKVADLHLAIHRLKTDPDPWRRNVMKVVIMKNRFAGRTGPALWLFYEEETGRLRLLGGDAARKYEEGLSLTDVDIPL